LPVQQAQTGSIEPKTKKQTLRKPNEKQAENPKNTPKTARKKPFFAAKKPNKAKYEFKSNASSRISDET